MIDPLTIMGLIKFIPDLVGLFDKKRGKKTKEAIDTIGAIAEVVTGKTGDEAVNAIAKDPKLAYEFQLAVMADSHVQEQLAFEDRKSAREAYKVNNSQADKIAENIMKRNLPIILLLVVINIASVIYLKDQSAIIAIISSIIGIVIGNLNNERQQVVGFYMGSSLGSKIKGEKT